MEALERKHHPFSPSKLQSLECCPCFESRDSKHVRSIAGTLAHKVTETRLDDAALSDDDAAAAAECLDFYEHRKALMEDERRAAVDFLMVDYDKSHDQGPCMDNYHRADSEIPPLVELSETYLPIDNLATDDLKTTTGGFIDKAIVSFDGLRAEMFDWKFGRWAVEEAKNNLQAMAYALGMFRRYPHLQQVRFWFKQPLTNTIDDHTFTRADVARIYQRIMVVVERAREARRTGDFSTANPTVPNCLFCANIGRCPKVADFSCHVGKKFHPLGLPNDISTHKVLSPEETALGLQLAAVVKVWCDAFRGRVTDRILNGECPVPPGYTIEKRFGDREIVDAKKYREHCLKYMTEEQYLETVKPSFGAVEEKISDNNPRGHKKAAIENFQAEILADGTVIKGAQYCYLAVDATQT